MELQVCIHKDEETGLLWASVVQLPGCFATGRTKDELIEALTEAVGMYTEGLDPETIFESVAVENYRLSTDAGLIPA